MRLAIFPGSFDPFTIGHQQIVEQSLQLFDQVIIAIGISASKVPLLELNLRLDALRETFASEARVQIMSFNGLVISFAKQQGARFLIRGLRSETDLAFELPRAHTTRALDPSIQTVFLPTAPDLSFISSTLIREIAKHGGDFAPFVPAAFAKRLKK
ncbi:MAG: pantetheine-phosphate adenylyltransferase [Proteobacteria bacterium]|nr:pantetheine-phosphate adenylyltransferase [Pseudomonadota bacterium]